MSAPLLSTLLPQTGYSAPVPVGGLTLSTAFATAVAGHPLINPLTNLTPRRDEIGTACFARVLANATVTAGKVTVEADETVTSCAFNLVFRVFAGVSAPAFSTTVPTAVSTKLTALCQAGAGMAAEVVAIVGREMPSLACRHICLHLEGNQCVGMNVRAYVSPQQPGVTLANVQGALKQFEKFFGTSICVASHELALAGCYTPEMRYALYALAYRAFMTNLTGTTKPMKELADALLQRFAAAFGASVSPNLKVPFEAGMDVATQISNYTEQAGTQISSLRPMTGVYAERAHNFTQLIDVSSANLFLGELREYATYLANVSLNLKAAFVTEELFHTSCQWSPFFAYSEAAFVEKLRPFKPTLSLVTSAAKGARTAYGNALGWNTQQAGPNAKKNHPQDVFSFLEAPLFRGKYLDQIPVAELAGQVIVRCLRAGLTKMNMHVSVVSLFLSTTGARSPSSQPRALGAPTMSPALPALPTESTAPFAQENISDLLAMGAAQSSQATPEGGDQPGGLAI